MFNNQINPYNAFPMANNNPFLYKQPFHINWKNLLNNTQKTLNVINQAAPLFYQIKPVYNNLRTLLKVRNIVRNDNSSDKMENIHNEKKNTNTNEPVFFL